MNEYKKGATPVTSGSTVLVGRVQTLEEKIEMLFKLNARLRDLQSRLDDSSNQMEEEVASPQPAFSSDICGQLAAIEFRLTTNIRTLENTIDKLALII